MNLQAPAFSYRLLSAALFPLWVLHALWHAIKNHQADYFWQRLGLTSSSKTHSLWIHASSVGEVELVKPLVQELCVSQDLLVSTFTATGYQHARRIMPSNVKVEAMPIDFLWLSKRFMQGNNFKIVIIAETELWPETLYQAKKQQIPLLQVNARLSAKSLQSANWIKNILSRTLNYFDLHLTRNEQDKNNLLSMQVNPQHINICGNLKLAASFDNQQHSNLVSRPYILFASTHDPEEKQFAEIYKQLDTNTLCVIAPRHPQRANDILKSLETHSSHISQRSQKQAIRDTTEIYLADTLGELKALMQHAELVVMGGSFHQVGGHNVLEAASQGKAVITGPDDNNIKSDISLLMEHEAIVQVSDINELKQVLQQLLGQPERLNTLATNAAKVMRQQQHILQTYLQAIERYL